MVGWVFLVGVAVTPEAQLALGSEPDALARVSELEDRYGWVIDVERPYDLDANWRGTIRIEPQWPVGRYRRHLEHISATARDIERVFAFTREHAQAAVRFRWRNLEMRVFRSVNRRTPSAYAGAWRIGYNVRGSLMRSERGVRETLFHELFHLNDENTLGGYWSDSALREIYVSIVARCAGDNSCLSRYAPGTTKVKGSTYYAFHPAEGVEEYAAELAARWYREHRRLADGRAVSAPFKCQAPENARAWTLMVDRFFGGIDAVGSCSGHAASAMSATR
ncbi:MAG: hypothetical protein AAFQ82_09735 [Myxococcota bacterium]